MSRTARLALGFALCAVSADLLGGSIAHAQVTSDCDPACREGYLCSRGQCITACNPPCAGNERCTAELSCVPRPTQVDAPAAAAPPAPVPKPPPLPPPPPPPPAARNTSDTSDQEPKESDAIVKARRAKFSAGRYIVESLGSAVVGSLASYGTYVAACGGTPCLGGAVGGLVVDIGVTPLAAYGIGRAMGGDGNLGSTYLVGLAAFAGGGAATGNDALLVLAIGMIIEPFAAALGYELSSSINAHKVLGPAGWVRPTVSPIVGDRDSVRGASLGVTAQF